MDTVFFVNVNPNAAVRNHADNGRKDRLRSIRSRDPADSAEDRVYVFYTFGRGAYFVDIVFRYVYN